MNKQAYERCVGAVLSKRAVDLAALKDQIVNHIKDNKEVYGGALVGGGISALGAALSGRSLKDSLLWGGAGAAAGGAVGYGLNRYLDAAAVDKARQAEEGRVNKELEEQGKKIRAEVQAQTDLKNNFRNSLDIYQGNLGITPPAWW